MSAPALSFHGFFLEVFDLSCKLDLSLPKTLQSLLYLLDLRGLLLQPLGHVGNVALGLLPSAHVLVLAVAVHDVALDAVLVRHVLKLDHDEVLQVGKPFQT